jgi:hypothetical protein
VITNPQFLEEITMITAKDYDKALLTPSKIFELPMEVVETDSLTSVQKLKVLKRWEADAKDMQVASSESMTGGEVSRFDEVREAIHALCERADIHEEIEAK